jgi:hypothetical protein
LPHLIAINLYRQASDAWAISVGNQQCFGFRVTLLSRVLIVIERSEGEINRKSLRPMILFEEIQFDEPSPSETSPVRTSFKQSTRGKKSRKKNQGGEKAARREVEKSSR